jgi:hypothetical protein
MKSKSLGRILDSRFGGILLIYFVFIGISFLSRTVLCLMSFGELSFNPLDLIWSYGGGIFMDTVAYSYFMIPFVLFLMFVPDFIFNSLIYKFVSYIVYFIAFYILIFNGVSEYFFWEEFGVRYNFIAVDYLVYTTEVLGNIKESYPMPLLISGILIADAALIYYIVKKKYLEFSFRSKSTLKSRLRTGLALFVSGISGCFYSGMKTRDISSLRYNKSEQHQQLKFRKSVMAWDMIP